MSLDDFINGVKAEQNTNAAANVDQSLRAVVQKNPDEMARYQDISRKTGVDPLLISDDPTVRARMELAAHMDSINVDDLVQTHPVTSNFLSDPSKAAVSHDSIDNFKAIEDAVKGFGSSMLAGAGPKLSEGLYGAVRAGVEVFAPNSSLANYFGQLAAHEKQVADAMVPKTDSIAMSGVYSGAESLGQNLAMLPLGIAAKSYGALTTLLGVITGGQSFTEARDEKVPFTPSLVHGVSQGAIEKATEMLGMPALFKMIKPSSQFGKHMLEYLVKEQGGEQLATLGQDLNDWAVLPENKDKTFGDYLAERPSAALQTAIATAVGGAGMVAVAKGVAKAAEKFDTNYQKAQQVKGALEQIDALAKANPVRTRDSQTFKAFMDAATKDMPVQDLYIDSNVLLQSGKAEELAQFSPAVAEQLASATLGTTVRIPVADYAAHVAGSDMNEALLPHIKIDPNDMSTAEADAELEAQKAEVLKMAEATLAGNAQQVEFQKSRDLVREQVQKNLMESGGFTKQSAAFHADLIAARAAVGAHRLGIMPDQHFANTIKVVAGKQALDRLQAEDATRLAQTAQAEPTIIKAAKGNFQAQIIPAGKSAHVLAPVEGGGYKWHPAESGVKPAVFKTEQAAQEAVTANPYIAPVAAKITFEVAPHPTLDPALKLRWDNLPFFVKQQISTEMMHEMAGKVAAITGVEGSLHEQLGGWKADTSPSASIWFDDSADMAKVAESARLLGYALNQEGMMLTSSTAFEGSYESGVVMVSLNKDGVAADAKSLYDELRANILDAEGQPIIQGHTSNADLMAILLDADQAQDVASRIAAYLGDRQDVSTGTINVAWPEKGEDDYGLSGTQNDSGAITDSPLRAQADQLRAEASRELDKRIAAYATRQGERYYQAVNEVLNGTTPEGALPQEDLEAMRKLWSIYSAADTAAQYGTSGAKAFSTDRHAMFLNMEQITQAVFAGQPNIPEFRDSTNTWEGSEFVPEGSYAFEWYESHWEIVDQASGKVVKTVRKQKGVRPTLAEGQMLRSRERFALASVDPKTRIIQLDVANWGEGGGGAGIYKSMLDFARNNKFVFEPDFRGVSVVANSRRLENLLSHALQSGDTSYMKLAPSQLSYIEEVTGTPLKWITGDNKNNIEQMLNASYNLTIRENPEVKNVYFDPTRRTVISIRTGAPFDIKGSVAKARRDFERMGGESTVGLATTMRGVLANTVLRAKGEAARRELFAALSQWSMEQLPGYSGLLYQQERLNTPKPTFYSALTRAVEGMSLKKGTPEQWAGLIKNLTQKGIKKEEIELSGIEDWLNGQAKLKDNWIVYDAEGNVTSAASVREYTRAELESVASPMPIRLSDEYQRRGLDPKSATDNKPFPPEGGRVERVSPSKSVTKDDVVAYLNSKTIVVEPIVKSGESQAEFDFSFGNWETEEPDTYYLEENARDRLSYADDDEKEQVAGPDWAEMSEEDLLKAFYDREEQWYWEDSESPQYRSILVDANGTNYVFDQYYSYGETYLREKNGREVRFNSRRSAPDDAEIQSAIYEFLGEQYDEYPNAEDAVKFDNYVLQGGRDNYRERLLINQSHTGEAFNYDGHWDEDNIIAFTRTNTRTVPVSKLKDSHPELAARLEAEGRKEARVYFLEELQSDWAQQGRDKSKKYEQVPYKLEDLSVDETESNDPKWDRSNYSISETNVAMPGNPPIIEYVVMFKGETRVARPYSDRRDAEEYIDRQVGQAKWVIDAPGQVFSILKKEHPTADSAMKYIAENKTRTVEAGFAFKFDTGEVPKGAFVQSTDAWVSLALKDAIREAAANDFDMIAWTTGSQQTARWSGGLRSRLDKIDWAKGADGKIRIVASRRGNTVADSAYGEGDLVAAIGKTMGDRIISDPNQTGSIEGDEIIVADLGMTKFYGDGDGNNPDGNAAIVPKVANNVLKKLGGGKVKAINMGIETKESGGFQPGFEITEEMKRLALEGQPLFHRTDSINRGFYDRRENLIGLLKDANLSTMIHELGHAFFEDHIHTAALLSRKEKLTDLEQGVIDDVHTLLDWHGLKGPIQDQLQQWERLTEEERTQAHERTAESFEGYLFEGKAPSLALQRVFSTFRNYLLGVYGSIKKFLTSHPEAGKINDEIRGVFDRMLATDDEIRLAQESSSMRQYFATANEAGMTPGEFAKYQREQQDATDTAVSAVQARALRDLQWLNNARSKRTKAMQDKASGKRREVRMDVRREVLQEPVYQAWQFLTGAITPEDKIAPAAYVISDKEKVTPEVDSLFTAIAKLGGVSRDQVVAEWGMDPKDKLAGGLFQKPVWRKEGGLSIDDLAGRLASYGYLPKDADGKVNLHDFEEAFKREHSGDLQYSTRKDHTSVRPGDQVINPSGLTAGRLDLGDVLDTTSDERVAKAVQDRGMTSNKGDGLHTDMVAAQFGFDSGADMLRALADATPLDQEIEARTDAEMLTRHGELSSPEAIAREVDKAIHNDIRARLVATDLNALNAALGRRKILATTARDAAHSVIARTKIRDVYPSVYSASAARAARAANRARAKGDIASAAAEVRNELFNTYATRAAYSAQEEVDKGVKYLKKLAEAKIQKNMRGESQAQLLALLDRFDIRKSVSLKEIDRKQTLLEFAAKRAEELSAAEPDIAPVAADETRRTHYKNLTVEEFRGLVSTVKQLEHLARREYKAYITLRNMTLQQEVDAGVDEIRRAYPKAFDVEGNAIVPTAGDKNYVPNIPAELAKRLRTVNAEVIPMEFLVDQLTAGRFGTLHDSLFGRLSHGADNKARIMGEIHERIKPAYSAYSLKEKRDFSRKEVAPRMTREQLVMLALYYGSEEGRQRLLSNYAQSDIEDRLSRLEPKDLDLIEAIWSLNDDYIWPMYEKLNINTQGKAPPKVKAVPFTVNGRDLKGGYVKLVYDKDLDEDTRARDAVEEARAMIAGRDSMRAKTAQGSSKERVEELKKMPLLSMTAIGKAINEHVHDIAYREAVADTIAILKNKKMMQAIKAVGGDEMYSELLDKTKEVASRPVSSSSIFARFLNHARTHATVVVMSGVKTALINYSGLVPAVLTGRVNAGALTLALAKIHSHKMFETLAYVKEKSAYMAERNNNFTSELNHELASMTVKNRIMPEMGTFLILMRIVDQATSSSVWLAAYRDGVRRYPEDDARAVEYADHVVRSTQGSGRVVDTSKIMSRFGDWARPFLMFYSYMNGQLALLVRQGIISKHAWENGRKAEAVGKITAAYLGIVVLPALINDLATGKCDKAIDGQEGFAKCVSKAIAMNMAGYVPIVRDLAPYAWDKLSDEHDYGLRMTSVTAYFEGMAKGLKATEDVLQGEGTDKSTKEIFYGLAYTLGLPGKLMWDLVAGTESVINEDAPPQAILFGPPKKQ